MPFFPVDDALTVTIHGVTESGEKIENVFGFQNTTEVNQGLADAFGNLVADAYGLLTDFWTDAVQFNGVTVTDLREEDAPSIESVAGFPVFGVNAGQLLPLQVAALVSWKTEKRGKSFRGRTYLGGFIESASDGAHISSALHTAIGNWADQMMDGTALGVISRYHGFTIDGDTGKKIPTPRDPGIITIINGNVAHDLWATQRRRAPR